MNCTGKNCIMQYDKVDPATCPCVPYCPQATPPKTNGDKIRQMTDEKLAAWLEGLVQIVAESGRDAFDQTWLEWLKEDVKERHYDPPQKTNAQKFEEVFGWPQSDIDSLRYARAWWDEPYKEQGGRNEG